MFMNKISSIIFVNKEPIYAQILWKWKNTAIYILAKVKSKCSFTQLYTFIFKHFIHLIQHMKTTISVIMVVACNKKFSFKMSWGCLVMMKIAINDRIGENNNCFSKSDSLELVITMSVKICQVWSKPKY